MTLVYIFNHSFQVGDQPQKHWFYREARKWVGPAVLIVVPKVFQQEAVNLENQAASLTPLLLCVLQTSDYINASFMDGYKRGNAYIATQGELLTQTMILLLIIFMWSSFQCKVRCYSDVTDFCVLQVLCQKRLATSGAWCGNRWYLSSSWPPGEAPLPPIFEISVLDMHKGFLYTKVDIRSCFKIWTLFGVLTFRTGYCVALSFHAHNTQPGIVYVRSALTIEILWFRLGSVPG